MVDDKLIVREEIYCEKNINFCKEVKLNIRPKYIFGTNERTKSLIENIIDIKGIIDDYTTEKELFGKPIIPIDEIPVNALLISVAIEKTWLVEERLSQFQFQYIDYFQFYKYSDYDIIKVPHSDGIHEDIVENYKKYEDIYQKLEDKISKNQFYNLVNFRFSYDINFLKGFSWDIESQYFEDFLNLKNNEVFIDIGAYDGATSLEFIKRHPLYQSIHIFEPISDNMKFIKEKLKRCENISYYNMGLSNQKDILKFEANASCSKISDSGSVKVLVDKLDNILLEIPTYIKIDIEGAESLCIEGAKDIIKKYQPKLAISVYHKKDDFWKIPEQVLNIRCDYNIYLRHYTQGIAETVMFFIPKN